MSWIRHDGNYPTGFEDEDIADAVFNAPTKREADAAARKFGLKDAEDAIKWCVERSPEGWVG